MMDKEKEDSIKKNMFEMLVNGDTITLEIYEYNMIRIVLRYNEEKYVDYFLKIISGKKVY